MDPLLLDGGLVLCGVGLGLGVAWFHKTWRFQTPWVIDRHRNDDTDRTLHELHLNSVEETAGRRIGVYTCSRCQPPHIERRELAS